MSETVTAAAYMKKAERALASARMLLEGDDSDGACNRAYYAMFDAAHAALATVVLASEVTVPRTHSGLIAAFGKYVIQGQKVDAEFGRAINQVENTRLLADYTGEPVSRKEAEWAVEQAAAFVAAMRSKFMTPESGV